MRILRGRGPVGREAIEAKRRAAHDDSLRCCLFPPIAIRPAAAKCAANSARIGMETRLRGRVRSWPGCLFRSRRTAGDTRARSVSAVCQRRRGNRARRRRSAAFVGRRRWDSRRRGRRPGDGRGRAPPVGARRQLGRRAAARQGRADLALAPVEPFPDALPGPLTEMAVRGADSRANTAGDGTLEERPQRGGGQAEPSDFVGEPDAERVPAAGPGVAVAAKDPPGADRLSRGVAVVKAVQTAVPNQGADDLAVRTGRQFEPFRRSRSNPRRCGKTMFPRPLGPCLPENRDSIGVAEGRGSGGVRERSLRGVRGKNRCQVPGVITTRRSDDTSATIRPNLRPERGKGHLSAWRRGGVVAGYEKDPCAGCGVRTVAKFPV